MNCVGHLLLCESLASGGRCGDVLWCYGVAGAVKTLRGLLARHRLWGHCAPVMGARKLERRGLPTPNTPHNNHPPIHMSGARFWEYEKS